MGFLRWGKRIKRAHVLCPAQHVLPADTGAALPKVAVAMLKLGVWYFGVALGHKSICFFLPISCREHQPPTCQQRKAPILSQKSFAPHFVFALDAFSPPHNYVPPWLAFLLWRNSRQLWELRLPWLSDQLPGMQHWKCTTALVGAPAFPCPGQQQGQGHFKNLPWRVPYSESYLFSPLRCGNKIHSSIYFSRWQSSGVFRNSLPMLQLTFSGYVPSSSDSPETVTHGLYWL